MKNTQHHNQAEPGASDMGHSIGAFPDRLNTVTAEVLRQLLCGVRMSGMNAVFDASTTRLASSVHSLAKKYEWGIDRADELVNTQDGRVTEIRRYYLTDSTIHAAMQAGGREFCEGVRTAREQQRNKDRVSHASVCQAVAAWSGAAGLGVA